MTPRPRPPWWALALLLVVSAELTLQITAFGYRWWAGHARSSPVTERAFTVLCLGDSFTWGLGAPPDQSYPRQLERLLARQRPRHSIRVVNHGIPGNNSWGVLRELHRVLAEVQPDLILLLVGLNDQWLEDVDLSALKTRDDSVMSRLTLRLNQWLFNIRLYRLAQLMLRRPDRQRTIATQATVPEARPEPAIVDDHADVDPLLTRAHLALDRQDHVQLEALASEALEAYPASAEAAFLMGKVANRQGEFEQARAMFRRATALDPSIPDYWRELGFSSVWAGHPEASREAWREAFRLDHKLSTLGQLGQSFDDVREGRQAMRVLLDEVKTASARADWAQHNQLIEHDITRVIHRLRAAHLERIVREAAARKIRVGLLTYPTGILDSSLYRQLRDVTDREPDVLLIDATRELAPRYADPAEALVTAEGAHPNAKGYGLLARFVLQHLTDANLLPH